MKYCEAIYSTKRRKTREVKIGHIGIGGSNPIRIQSMTTSNTRDIEATVGQILKLADAGCEIVRMTVQGISEAEACEQIKNRLLQIGCSVPLVADIHFFPPAAMKAVEFVEKIRINPGNYADKRATFKILEYDDAAYAKELEKIEEKFAPLVQKCKQYGRAMRIGTNHGSLSDRIMNRYGDTPAGMVESAIEFAQICRKYDFHDFLFSMKASNPQVMIQAYRLLTAKMYELDWDYPLHLGVTEAGEGEDGRIKSAIGIGSLLLEGLGDTVRVSLTEDPWHEIEPCRQLINLANSYLSFEGKAFTERYRDPYSYSRRSVKISDPIPFHNHGTVFLSISQEEGQNPRLYDQIGCEIKGGALKLKTTTADYLVTDQPAPFDSLKKIGIGIASPISGGDLHLLTLSEANSNQHKSRFQLIPQTFSKKGIIVENSSKEEWEALKFLKPAIIFFKPTKNRLHESRNFFEWIQKSELSIPVILHFTYSCSEQDLLINAAAECGALLCDGLGDGLWLTGPYPVSVLRNLSFNILQAARLRTIKTDFISCPSCGRTLFDLQEVTKRIKSRTAHLPGVKIAIMGCIVNGPGEMADADFGYVGSGRGLIDLYVGKTCVEKGIKFSEADDRLVALIKTHGKWVEHT